jgi:cell division septum initiation protein DivIVA
MSNFTWEYIQKHPKQTKRLLGIDYNELEQIIEQGKIAHQNQKEETEKKKIRINRAGGGNHPKLSEEQQIVLTLIYLRHNLSFQLLGLLFEVSESTAHNLFDYWQRLLQRELPCSLLEHVKKFPEEITEIKTELTHYELLVDSSEQAIERPSDYQTQQKYYSGKQKRHTMKSQFIVLPELQDIVDVVVGQAGATSDIKIWRDSQIRFDNHQLYIGDKAYVGEPQIITPHKQPKNQELTEAEKSENKVISSQRIFVEHLIRVVKIFKIMQERFRLKRTRYKSILLTICGLVRVRIGAVILRVIKSAESGEVVDVINRYTFPVKSNIVTSNCNEIVLKAA